MCACSCTCSVCVCAFCNVCTYTYAHQQISNLNLVRHIIVVMYTIDAALALYILLGSRSIVLNNYCIIMEHALITLYQATKRLSPFYFLFVGTLHKEWLIMTSIATLAIVESVSKSVSKYEITSIQHI